MVIKIPIENRYRLWGETPALLSFGKLHIGTSKMLSATMKNLSNSTLNISSVVASSPYTQTNTCGSSLGAGASCTITATYKPTAQALQYGERAGTRALSLFAPRAAVEHFTSAMDAAARLSIAPSPSLSRARGQARRFVECRQEGRVGGLLAHHLSRRGPHVRPGRHRGETRVRSRHVGCL